MHIECKDVDILYYIAIIKFKMGDRKEAKDIFEAVVKSFKKNDNNLTNTTAWLAYSSLGFHSLLTNNPKQALQEFSEALDWVEKLSGKLHPHHHIAITFSYMAIAAYQAANEEVDKLDMLHESLRYLRRAKHTMRQVDNDEVHPMLGSVNSTMGVIFTQLGKFQEARACLHDAKQQFKTIQKKILKSDHITQELIEIENNVACLDFEENRIEDARKGFEAASQLIPKLKHKNVVLTAKLMANLEKTQPKLKDEKSTSSIGEDTIDGNASQVDKAVDAAGEKDRVISVISIELNSTPPIEGVSMPKSAKPEFSILF